MAIKTKIVESVNSNLGVTLGVVFLGQIYFIYSFNKLDSPLKVWCSHRIGFMGKFMGKKFFKTGDIVKIISSEGTIIFNVLSYGRIDIIRIFPPAETGAETGWPLDWQIIQTWRGGNEKI